MDTTPPSRAATNAGTACGGPEEWRIVHDAGNGMRITQEHLT